MFKRFKQLFFGAICATSFMSAQTAPVKVVNPDVSSQQVEFEKLLQDKSWQLVFDDCCTADWTEQWFMDGQKSTLAHTADGMTLAAGPVHKENASHTVLWTKQSFEGPLRIEYDFTRRDSNTYPDNVNILYVLAQGSGTGAYAKDISLWSDLRQVPAMRTYFNNMQTYHISYAVNYIPYSDDYVRARRYAPEAGGGLKGTELNPEYASTGLFEIDKTYHITVIAYHSRVYMRVQADQQDRLFYFDIPQDKILTHGRIGLRQMWTRISTYKDFKVYQLS